MQVYVNVSLWLISNWKLKAKLCKTKILKSKDSALECPWTETF